MTKLTKSPDEEIIAFGIIGSVTVNVLIEDLY
jgi:hypothetical protein